MNGKQIVPILRKIWNSSSFNDFLGHSNQLLGILKRDFLGFDDSAEEGIFKYKSYTKDQLEILRNSTFNCCLAIQDQEFIKITLKISFLDNFYNTAKQFIASNNTVLLALVREMKLTGDQLEFIEYLISISEGQKDQKVRSLLTFADLLFSIDNILYSDIVDRTISNAKSMLTENHELRVKVDDRVKFFLLNKLIGQEMKVEKTLLSVNREIKNHKEMSSSELIELLFEKKYFSIILDFYLEIEMNCDQVMSVFKEYLYHLNLKKSSSFTQRTIECLQKKGKRLLKSIKAKHLIELIEQENNSNSLNEKVVSNIETFYRMISDEGESEHNSIFTEFGDKESLKKFEPFWLVDQLIRLQLIDILSINESYYVLFNENKKEDFSYFDIMLLYRYANGFLQSSTHLLNSNSYSDRHQFEDIVLKSEHIVSYMYQQENLFNSPVLLELLKITKNSLKSAFEPNLPLTLNKRQRSYSH